MSQKSISKMDSKCLFEIFNQMKQKCETEKQEKYWDLVRFVTSIDWLRNQFYQWNKEFYEQLEIDKNNRNKTVNLLDIDVISEALHKFTQNERDKFWELLTDGLKENRVLKHITVKWISYLHKENHQIICDMIINALQNKPSLQFLSLDLKEYTFSCLPFIHRLQELQLNVKMNASDLVECCKVNPHLERLMILTDDISGKLSDIALDGESLQKLESLDFRMKPEVDAAEYATLAKLPKVSYIQIMGKHKTGTLRNLFEDLAHRKSPKGLLGLFIDEALLTTTEIQAISQIDTLEELECGFTEVESIGQLSQLSQLTELRITANHDLRKVLAESLKIFQQCQRDYVAIFYRGSGIHYDKDNETLKWDLFENDADASDYTILSEVPNLRTLQITTRNNKIKFLSNLLKKFSNTVPQTLEHLQLLNDNENVELNSNDISEISTIKSLKSVEGTLGDLSNIYLLAQLQHLTKLNLRIANTLGDQEAEALKKLFTLLALKPSPSLEDIELSGVSVDLPTTMELVKIKSIKKLKCSFSNDKCIEHLLNLKDLEYLDIESKHDFNQISKEILQLLSTSQTSLKINCDSTSVTYESSKNSLSLSMELSPDATSLGPLGTLEKCQIINVFGECKLGSFHSLLETLASRKDHNLRELNIEQISLNYEQNLLVSQIKTLEILTCDFGDSRCFEILHSNCHFKRIKFNQKTLPSQILSFLNSSHGTVIIENNERHIIYYKNQGKLMFKNIGEVVDASDYTCLGNLDNLKSLHILGDYASGSLTELFKQLTSSLSFEELLFERNVEDDKSVDEELLEIAKMKSLKKLKCGFVQTPNSGKLAQLQELKELTITTHPFGSLQELFQEFSSQTSTTLQYLSIEDKGLSVDELKAIACIQSLKELKCININTENGDGIPTLPYLKELCITSHLEGKLFTSPEFFVNCSLQSITIMGAALNIEDIAALTQYKSLQKLQIMAENFEPVKLLSSHEELEELCIELIEDSPDVCQNVPKFPKNIRKLTVKNWTLNSKDFAQILKLSHLKSLDCILSIEENDILPQIDELEELIITLPKLFSGKKILEALTQRTSSTLKHLAILDDILDVKDVIELSKIQSLTYLKCELLRDKSLQYLTQLINLKTLIISSDYYIDQASEHFLNIIRDCTKLEYMDIGNSDEEIDRELISKILDILKNVRDSSQQEPLKLQVPYYPGFSNEKVNSMEQKYLTIDMNK